MLAFFGPNWKVRTARLLAALWAGFWIWFGVASGIAENAGLLGTIIHTAVPGLAFGLLLAAAWRWPRVGGTLLILMALVVAAGYPFLIRNWWRFYPFILLTMALPPLAAGLLLIVSRRGQHV